MSRKASQKNFYREIRKSPGRFLSIFFIVAMGVAFFSGIRSSEPSMRITGDAYFDEADLMDLQVMSSLGLTEDDVAAFGQIDGVELAEGAYSADFLCDKQDRQDVFHVMSLTEKVNHPDILEGRMPRRTGECLMDADMGYRVGNTVTLKSGTDDPLEDTLKTNKFEIVGLASSPCYVSFERGSATIGSGSISGFILVPEETFSQEVYSEVYIKVEGAEEETAYTEAYEEKIEAVKDRVEDLTGERGKIRKNEILAEAEEEIEKGQKELDEGQAEADQELADAAAKIADGETQLSDARTELADGRKQLEDGKAELVSGQQEIDSARKQYEDGLAKWKSGQTEYENGLAEYEAQKPAAEAAIREGEAQLSASRQQLDEGWAGYETLTGQITELDTQIAGLQQQIQMLEEQIQEAQEGPGEETPEEPGEETPEEPGEETPEEPGEETPEESGEETPEEPGEETPEEPGKEAARAPQGLLEELMQQLATARATLEQLETGRESLRVMAEETYQQLESGEAAYQAGKEELEAARGQLADGAAELANAKATLDASKTQLDSALSQITSGQKKIDDGWAEIHTQEQKLEDGEARIQESETELADAKQEYEEGKTEAEAELADAREELASAREELEKIEDPTWYINDRGSLPEYDGYGENADRMRALGRVFPVLFFLVAALISLTSMTRMVEEQRIEIGTMKALGYDRFTIAAKYLGYALIATVGGSILGVLFGEKVLPYIIIYAYGILYQHIPEILVPYDWSYAGMASAAALACTMIATWYACYKELGDQPAVLMRPPAPKIGKRVFLERVTPVWRRLNFTWKSTVRNLMRYKKRFFMTIFGIGGCMGLMLVGFGLRDSIYEIADLQYEEIQTYDGSAYLQDDVTEEDRERLDEFMQEDPDVTRHINAYMMNVTLENAGHEHEAYLTILADTDQVGNYFSFHDRVSDEEYHLSDHGAIISEKTAKLLDAEAGDTLLLEDDDGGTHELKIEHICENYMAHYIYMTPAYYEEVTGEPPQYNCILFQMDPSYTKDEMEEAGERIVSRDEVLSVTYMHDIEKQLDDMLGSLNLVIVVLIISAGMLAFVVLYNLNTINITERQRELATLKVLGFYDLEVAEYVYRENILLTFIGAGVGALLGKVLHLFVIETVEVDAAMFGRIIHPSSYLYSLAFTIVFSMIVNFVMFYKLRKIDMVESLKSIE